MNARALAALALVAAAALTGCASGHTPDEAAFLAALHDGTTVPGLTATDDELRAATIAAGRSVCTVIDTAPTEAEGIAAARENAARNLTGPVFTEAMPDLFVDAAAVHLCGVTP